MPLTRQRIVGALAWALVGSNLVLCVLTALVHDWPQALGSIGAALAFSGIALAPASIIGRAPDAAPQRSEVTRLANTLLIVGSALIVAKWFA